jgi:hypothetical protein
VLVVSALLALSAWAGQSEGLPQQSIKTAQLRSQAVAPNPSIKPITKVKAVPNAWDCPYPYYVPKGVTKVSAADCVGPYGSSGAFSGCYLPMANVGQWEMSAGVIFARLRGKIAWPRYPMWGYGYGYGYNAETDFTDGLQLPAHQAVPTWTVKYQFRPNWAVRYTGLGFEANGGGQPTGYVSFGPWQQYYYGSYGQGITSKYQHGYHRVGLLYDALKSCKATVKVFADWVHVEDRIEVSTCISCNQNSVFSKTTDAAATGIEFQKCLKTANNGGTLSCDWKAGAIFLDNVEGWDVQAGAQYAIPLNCGRSGYVKGGYRLVELKKGQNDYLLADAVQGGFMEFGFIF